MVYMGDGEGKVTRFPATGPPLVSSGASWVVPETSTSTDHESDLTDLVHTFETTGPSNLTGVKTLRSLSEFNTYLDEHGGSSASLANIIVLDVDLSRVR